MAYPGVIAILTLAMLLAGCTTQPTPVVVTQTVTTAASTPTTAPTTTVNNAAGTIQIWFIGMYGNQTRDVEFTPISDGDLGTSSGSSVTNHVVFTGQHLLSTDNPTTEAFTVPPSHDPSCTPATIGMQIRISRLGQEMLKQNIVGPHCGDGKAWILTFAGGPYTEGPNKSYNAPYQMHLDGPKTMFCPRGTLMENAGNAGCNTDPNATPSISFSQDKAAKTLEVVSADKADWKNVQLLLTNASGAGCTGTDAAGNAMPPVGTGRPATAGYVAAGGRLTIADSTPGQSCVLQLTYIPNGHALGTWTFNF